MSYYLFGLKAGQKKTTNDTKTRYNVLTKIVICVTKVNKGVGERHYVTLVDGIPNY